MAVDKLVDSAALNNALAYTASRMRAKTSSSSLIPFDLEHGLGFGDAVDAIPSGGGSVTHVQYTAVSDAITNATGGNAYDFYNTYMAPNIPTSGNVIVICFVTNNAASVNYAKIMEYYRDQKLRGTTSRYYLRGTSVQNTFQNNYDFLYTSGSLIDIWILEDVLS